MSEADRTAQAPAAMRDRADGQPETRGYFAIRHDAKQSLLFRTPLVQFGSKLWDLEVDSASLHRVVRAPKALGQVPVGHRSH